MDHDIGLQTLTKVFNLILQQKNEICITIAVTYFCVPAKEKKEEKHTYKYISNKFLHSGKIQC